MAAHAHPQTGRAADRPRLEVADIVRAHGEAFARAHVLSPEQHAVLRDIGRCRTAALGGYVDVCDACGHVEVGYHLLPAVRADFLMKLNRFDEARTELERAAALTRNARERALLLERAAACAAQAT